ncbi:MAG: cell wall hydrolase [Clostridia bacterium]|nr:cell wall hydrolase [Clostridia bacterium]
MNRKNNGIRVVAFIIVATVILGTPSIVFAGRFDSSQYISDEPTVDKLLEPIIVEVEDVSEEMAYEDVLKELEDAYNSLNESIEEIQPIIKDLYAFYKDSEDSIVCRDANIAFNGFSESYKQYRELLLEIKVCTATYESRYDYLQNSIILDPEVVNKEGYEIIADEENLSEMYRVAKEKADTLFDQDYDLMCRVGFAEAGAKPSADPKEHYAVWGVIDNRVKDNDYPNTTYDVIYSGAYECVSNGSINKEAPELVKKYAEDYLRGYVDFDMPDDVVYQSRSRQGSKKDDPWWESPLGHYFCRK